MGGGLSADCERESIGFSTPFGTVLTIKMSPWRDIAREFHTSYCYKKPIVVYLKYKFIIKYYIYSGFTENHVYT